MKRLDQLTPVERERIARFADNLFTGIEIRKELAKLSNEEFARVLLHVADDMVIESPQAVLIEVAAERLGYKFDEPAPHRIQGHCMECHKPMMIWNTASHPMCKKCMKEQTG